MDRNNWFITCALGLLCSLGMAQTDIPVQKELKIEAANKLRSLQVRAKHADADLRKLQQKAKKID